MAQEPHEIPMLNIRAVSRETGLKPDTIRAWERRYGLPMPSRTQGGHRLYSPRDIAVLKWLSDRREEGLSISRAVDIWERLSRDGQDPLATPQFAKPHQYTFPAQDVSISSLRDDWVQACMRFDQQAANQLLNEAFARYSVEYVCLELLIKGLANIGHDWYQGQITVQQEHFASELTIRRIESLLMASPQPSIPGQILVICPPDEQHTISALLITLFLRRLGWNAIFLGANVPLDRLEQTIQNTKPILVVLTSQQLLTAATALQVAQLLIEYDIPIAFGGRVYNLVPGVRDRIPGIFLGETLDQALSMILQLLEYAPPTPSVEPPEQGYLLALEEFHNRQVQVEVQVVQGMAAVGIHPDHLEIANTNLTQNIIAALTLGDISFLSSDIEWVKGLLEHQGIPTRGVNSYLQAYAEAVMHELGDRGSLIASFLVQLVREG
ncbi:MAG: MerR family transcriptional regulator [Anaerolineaceae bacterium]|nr:MAG: MerR family transcriptional regulator [Anaerolineaceae bacterium]